MRSEQPLLRKIRLVMRLAGADLANLKIAIAQAVSVQTEMLHGRAEADFRPLLRAFFCAAFFDLCDSQTLRFAF
jgi:hypothetical protein